MLTFHHLWPDHAMAFFDAEQQVSIWRKLSRELRQSGKARCIAKLLSRHVSLTLAAGVQIRQETERQHIRLYTSQNPNSLLY